MVIFGTESTKYKSSSTSSKKNGAYWYGLEIETNILPKIDANVIVYVNGASLYEAREVPDGSVVVTHDNANTERTYRKLFKKNVLFICSKQSTADKLAKIGEKAAYIPLSIDMAYVAKYKRAKKTKDTAFVGNAWSFKRDYLASLPKTIKQLSDMPREELLTEMSKYKNIIAEGRCMMEAQILGAKTSLPEYKNGHVAEPVQATDNKDVIPKWRKVLKAHETNLVIIRSMRSFYDNQERKYRKQGEIFMASPARADVILSHTPKVAERA